MSILLRPPHWFISEMADNANNLVQAKRLTEKMTGALPQQVARLIFAWIASHEANRDIKLQLANAVESLRSVEAGHLNIEENDRDLVAVIAAVIESFLTVGCGPNVKALILQLRLQNMPKSRFIIGNENATRSTAVGRVL